MAARRLNANGERSTKDFGVIGNGGGPGRYMAAGRISQVGLKTALVEKEHLGDLNWDCIPIKSLLRNAEVVHSPSRGRIFGFRSENLLVGYAEAQPLSRSVGSHQTRRFGILMKNHGFAVYEGFSRLTSAQEVAIKLSGESLRARNIILT